VTLVRSWPRSRVASGSKLLREADSVRKIALSAVLDASASQGDFAHPTGWVSAVTGTSNDKLRLRRVTHHCKLEPVTVGYAAGAVPTSLPSPTSGGGKGGGYRETPLTYPTN
jgi:hypothetical protein